MDLVRTYRFMPVSTERENPFSLKILSFYDGKYFRVKKQEMVILF